MLRTKGENNEKIAMLSWCPPVAVFNLPILMVLESLPEL